MKSNSDWLAKSRAQQAHIDQARVLLKPLPVRLHHCPRWFRRAGVLGPRRSYSAQWLDHWGSVKLADGRVAFVSEPYNVSAEDLAECEAIAAKIGALFTVDPNSWWFPGQTIRLVFVQPKGPR